LANTVNFTEGAFNVGVTERPGTNNIVVEEATEGFRLFNDDGSTIVGLVLLSDDEGINLFIGDPDSPGNTLEIENADLNLNAGQDRVEILGSARGVNASTSGGDRLIFDGRSAKSTFNTTTSDARTVIRFRGNDIGGNVSRGNELNLGSTADKLIFGGAVRNTTINDAGGQDFIRFRGNITNTEINLSPESQSTIRLSKNGVIDGFRINGADDNDILLIGSSQYGYQGDQTWTNIADPSDTRQF
jgi:hypothetical protein